MHQRKQTTYQLRFGGDNNSNPELKSSQSRNVIVGVVSSVSKVSLSTTSISAGSLLTLSATVEGPTTPTSVQVVAYRWTGKRWANRGTLKLKTSNPNANSAIYKVKTRLKTRGSWRFIARLADENGVTVSAPSRNLRVR